MWGSEMTQEVKNQQDMASLQESVLNSFGAGLWQLNLFEGKEPAFFGDTQFLKLLGVEDQQLTPEEIYCHWNRRLVEQYREMVMTSVEKMKNGKLAETTYLWKHPKLGVQYVRCGGNGEYIPGKGYIIKGYHRIVTDIVNAGLDYKRRLDTFNSLYSSVMEINLEDNEVLILREPGSIGKTTRIPARTIKEALHRLCDLYIASEDIEKVREFLELDNLACQCEHEKESSIECKDINGEWCRIVVVPEITVAGEDSKQYLLGIQTITREKERELEQKQQLEEALARAQEANAAKNTFLSRMSHDIRTPLNGIIGLLDIGDTHGDDIKFLKKNRDKARIAANHLLALINDVLEISKLDSRSVVLSREAIDIRDIIREINVIAGVKTSESGITLRYFGEVNDIENPYIYGSPLHIRQVFLNIIGNATKYNKPGGTVDCYLSLLEKTDSVVTYQCVIKDTGIGMSKEFLEHIFEPFAQEHIDTTGTMQGTGLGMSIVKGLVDYMGGTIKVESEVGLGSTFTVTLPFEIAPEEEVRKKRYEDRPSDINGVNILLVEDNNLNREIATCILEDEGANVICAGDGYQGVHLFKNNPPGTFDLILMDLMMPIMDGYVATKTIRGLDRPDAKEIPILAMTANAFLEDVKNTKMAGMNEHIAKPFDKKKLIATIAYYAKK